LISGHYHRNRFRIIKLINFYKPITRRSKNLKKGVIIPLLLVICGIAVCQTNLYTKKKVSNVSYHSVGDFSISGSPSVLFNTPNGIQFAGGAKMRFFVGKRLSFDTDIVFSKDYFHAGMGLIGIPLALLCLGTTSDEESSFSALLGFIAAIAISLEHTAYHIPISLQADLSPYVSLLRYKFAYVHGVYNDPNVINEQFSCAAGVELNRYYNRFILAPYLEFNMGYRDHIPAYNAGVYLGYYFRAKKTN
jgi:hypothetical protein